MTTMIRTLLVANRGEIACRVMRTARARGIRTVAVYSDADAGLPHVLEADVAVRLGPAEASQSYLNPAAVLSAAKRTGADAIHPGYGFLSENAAFAQAVIDAGLTWVGPSPEAIGQMGDKATARRLAADHGVPVLPGYDGEAQDADTLRAEASRIGVPLLVKAVAGGGGRGMRRVDDLADLDEAVASARREASSAFGDDRVLLERFVVQPRHIEVQVFGDAHGQVVHLGERECSIQRRHQKIVEEAPSPVIDEGQRLAMGEAAIRLARAVGYVGAGTVEYVLDQDGRFHFLEMNTRLQVEHPVTEVVYGVDLVGWQLDVAEGRPLPLDQAAIDDRRSGHAIEVRVYAEDPLRGGMPGTGTLRAFDLGAGPSVRVDAGYRVGDVVGASYDPMLAKVIACGRDRAEACRALADALQRAWVPGVPTNLPLLRQIAADEDFVAGALDTSFLVRRGLPVAPPSNLAAGARAAAVWSASHRAAGRPDPAVPAGFRITGPPEEVDRWAFADEEVEIGLTPTGPSSCAARVDGAEPVEVDVSSADAGTMTWTVAGLTQTVRLVTDGSVPAGDGETTWVHLGDGEAMVRLVPRLPVAAVVDDDPGSLAAPSPGVVRQVRVAVGDRVAAGQVLVVLEAMKMEQSLKAPVAGVVEAVRCEEGESVAEGVVLVVLDEEGEE